MGRLIGHVDEGLAHQAVKFKKNGLLETHFVTRVYLRSGRLHRYPNETLCGRPCRILPAREDAISARFCPKCMAVAERHGLIELEEYSDG